MKNSIELTKTYWASVSGGKDSLYMLAHILHNLDIYPLDGVVHFELEIDYPFITDVIDYMEEECKKYNIPFLRIKPRKSWEELRAKNGMPSMWRRWCNGEYKMDCAKQLNELMKGHNKQVVYYIGYCANEETRAKKHKKDTEIYPLVDAGIFEDTIWKWAKNQPIFNDFYKYNKRCGCMYCPLSSLQTLKYLSVLYPKEYKYFMSLCLESEHNMDKPFSIWTGNPKYNTEYRMKRIEEMTLKEVERW